MAASSICPRSWSSLAVTWLLIIGTTESATRQRRAGGDQDRGADAFIILTLPVLNGAQLPPLHPDRVRQSVQRYGYVGAAASIFFAYVGFDAVSTAAEETKNPQRNVPIGLIGSLLICTVFYLLVAAARSARSARSR